MSDSLALVDKQDVWPCYTTVVAFSSHTGPDGLLFSKILPTAPPDRRRNVLQEPQKSRRPSKLTPIDVTHHRVVRFQAYSVGHFGVSPEKMLNRLTDILDQLGRCDTPEAAWACGLYLFAAEGSD
jgi:hypothetical protein